MKQIPNQTLRSLIIATLIISVAGILLNLGGGQNAITGFLSANSTAVGRVNLTVPTTTFITLTDALIELDTIYPGAYNDSNRVLDWFTVQNDGNTNINVSAYSDTYSLFTGTGCTGVPNKCFGIGGHSQQSGNISVVINSYNGGANCTAGGNCGNYTAVPASAATAKLVCYNLGATDATDECTIGVNVTVPDDESGGDKNTYVTLLAQETTTGLSS